MQVKCFVRKRSRVVVFVRNGIHFIILDCSFNSSVKYILVLIGFDMCNSHMLISYNKIVK